MRNEIIAPHQIILLQLGYNTTSVFNMRKCVYLIAPYNDITQDVWLGRTTHVQTWVIRLQSGEETIAQMIMWFGR